jgi:phosphohistidine phosphatase
MKRITLVRHAKSDWSLPGQQDWDRVLNKRGQRDAPEMARRLRAAKLPKPDLVLTSPAVRAITTASIMARELKLTAAVIKQDERLYLADPQQIVEVLKGMAGAAGHVMVFGHNPGITECANRLSASEHIDNMPTCATFTATFAIASWTDLAWETGQDVVFDYPRSP